MPEATDKTEEENGVKAEKLDDKEVPESSESAKTPDRSKDQKDEKKFKAIESQEDFDARIANRLERLRKTIFQEVRDEVTSEASIAEAKKQGDYKKLLEDAQAKIDAYQAKEAQREHDALRAKVAKENSLPESAMKFLTGDDEDALNVSAKELAGLVGKPKEETDLDQGQSNNQKRAPKRAKKKDEDFSDPKKWGLGPR